MRKMNRTYRTDWGKVAQYLSGAILKDHNSGYITRRTCSTAPPQTKGFMHETGYYKIHVWLFSRQQAAEVFAKADRFKHTLFLMCILVLYACSSMENIN